MICGIAVHVPFQPTCSVGCGRTPHTEKAEGANTMVPNVTKPMFDNSRNDNVE